MFQECCRERERERERDRERERERERVGFDNNGSNSTQESSPNKEYNGSSVDCSANELSASKKMKHHVVYNYHVHGSRRGVRKSLRDLTLTDCKLSTKQTQNQHY